MKADIGLIGLAVMGENLALNMESKGFTVAVYNRSAPGEEGVVDRFINGRGKGRNFIGAHTIQELCAAIAPPRKVMMMVKAGKPVDELIAQLLPYLEQGDVIIDGGNSDFHDSARRVEALAQQGISFVGTGISGGEEGALHGPSIMPSGDEKAWPLVKDVFQRIAAKLDDGTPCCEWIGGGASGHFVKTIHNGIEYGDMQLIAETYAMMKHNLQLDYAQMAELFETWNTGKLNSFLIKITADILRFNDVDGSPMLDKILDVAGQKGTGKWSAMAALDEGDPMTLITEAVFARSLSALYDERKEASRLYSAPAAVPSTLTADELQQALYASKIVSYAQGFSVLRRASVHYGWSLRLGEIARIWRNGCIIRSAFLEKITEAYERQPELDNLLFDEFFRSEVEAALPAWRKMVAEGVLTGIALPAMSAALTYFDGLRTLHSPANLLQAQRDYFGAHTYERTDRPRGEFFHTKWNEVDR